MFRNWEVQRSKDKARQKQIVPMILILQQQHYSNFEQSNLEPEKGRLCP